MVFGPSEPLLKVHTQFIICCIPYELSLPSHSAMGVVISFVTKPIKKEEGFFWFILTQASLVMAGDASTYGVGTIISHRI